MDNSIRILTPTKDLAHNLCEAVSHAVQQDTDMFIMSRDKQLLPCHSSLLALFSPVVARLLSEIPCCAAPTIFLPDFHALPIRKLLLILRSGQAISGENVNTDIKKMIAMAKVLQISIADLSVGPFLDNPLGVTAEVKQESKLLNVKQERLSVDVVKVLNVKEETDSFNVKQEEKSAKQELMEQNEYIEEDVPEKTQKQEYAASVDDDKLLDDISDFQTVVEEEVEESIALDKEDYIPAGEQDNNIEQDKNKNCDKDEMVYSKCDIAVTQAANSDNIHDQPTHDWYEQVKDIEGDNNTQEVEQDLDDEVFYSAGERGFPCSVCSKMFASKSTLRDHKKGHSAEKPFQCSVCPKSFSRLSKLNIHNRSHTEKPYQCLVCTKSFSQMENLNSHKMIHTGEKPHQCSQCFKRFITLQNLKWHNKSHKSLKSHTGKKPHQCLVCSKSFSRLDTLTKHKKIHNKEKP